MPYLPINYQRINGDCPSCVGAVTPAPQAPSTGSMLAATGLPLALGFGTAYAAGRFVGLPAKRAAKMAAINAGLGWAAGLVLTPVLMSIVKPATV